MNAATFNDRGALSPTNGTVREFGSGLVLGALGAIAAAAVNFAVVITIFQWDNWNAVEAHEFLRVGIPAVLISLFVVEAAALLRWCLPLRTVTDTARLFVLLLASPWYWAAPAGLILFVFFGSAD